jgi:hypothetical protein
LKSVKSIILDQVDGIYYEAVRLTDMTRVVYNITVFLMKKMWNKRCNKVELAGGARGKADPRGISPGIYM